MADAGIVRNRAKIAATIGNARAYLDMREAGEDFSEFLCGFVGGKPIRNTWKSWQDIQAETPQSKAMSKALKARGFKFVGPTICYAFMQAVGHGQRPREVLFSLRSGVVGTYHEVA